jgi:predicted DsbA family dithiol-disulfide isomerase
MDNRNISCNLETNICGPTKEEELPDIKIEKQEKIKILYFTDPICSACWAIEPMLKKLYLEYGEYFDIEYKMGGLMPYWDGQGSPGPGMASVSHLAHHWDEVAEYSCMSIDGDIWLEDPLNSSYPPSYAFFAMQKQGEDIAQRFLRHLKEMLFLEKKNITKEKYLLEAVSFVNANQERFLQDYKSKEVIQRLVDDQNIAKSMNVRGFPTFIFLGRQNFGHRLSGINDYDKFVTIINKAYGSKLRPKPLNLNEYELLKKDRFLATKEISIILSKNETNVLKNLELLLEQGKIERYKHKWGDFWKFIESNSDNQKLQ